MAKKNWKLELNQQEILLTPHLDYVGEYTIIKIKGTKKKEKFPELQDNIYNTRKFGEFSLEIPLKTEDYLIKNAKPTIEDKKGLIIIQYLLEKNDEDLDIYEI